MPSSLDDEACASRLVLAMGGAVGSYARAQRFARINHEDVNRLEAAITLRRQQLLTHPSDPSETIPVIDAIVLQKGILAITVSLPHSMNLELEDVFLRHGEEPFLAELMGLFHADDLSMDRELFFYQARLLAQREQAIFLHHLERKIIDYDYPEALALRKIRSQGLRSHLGNIAGVPWHRFAPRVRLRYLQLVAEYGLDAGALVLHPGLLYGELLPTLAELRTAYALPDTLFQVQFLSEEAVRESLYRKDADPTEVPSQFAPDEAVAAFLQQGPEPLMRSAVGKSGKTPFRLASKCLASEGLAQEFTYVRNEPDYRAVITEIAIPVWDTLYYADSHACYWPSSQVTIQRRAVYTMEQYGSMIAAESARNR